MVLEQPFTTTPAALANFNYTDLSNGTGLVTFYLLNSQDDSALDYHLSPIQNYSSSVSDKRTSGTTELDFDLTPMNLTQYVEGTALLSIGIGTSTPNVNITAQLKHWDGSSETNLTAEITSKTVSGSPAAEMVFLEMPITTEKHFKRGDILRLTIKHVSGGSTTEVGHDPINRDGNWVTSANGAATIAQVQVPFRIKRP